ncbi:uncharacterized protein [Lepisosteus oculatus]
MPSFRACFRSIFRLHTETGNIWTHLIGFFFFLILGIGYMFSPNINFVAPVQEKVVFGVFFLGAVLCLCFSWLFHTVYCHSEKVSRTFSKLDYSGIALLIMGSFVPWLYYSFYCSPQPRLIYLVIICVLGITAIVVSQWDRFATPQYRAVRAVPLAPDLPRAGGGRGLCPSPWSLPAAGLPVLAGRRLHLGHHAVSPSWAPGPPIKYCRAARLRAEREITDPAREERESYSLIGLFHHASFQQIPPCPPCQMQKHNNVHFSLACTTTVLQDREVDSSYKRTSPFLSGFCLFLVLRCAGGSRSGQEDLRAPARFSDVTRRVWRCVLRHFPLKTHP